MGVLHIHERRQIRLFVRRAAYSRYYSCLVYAPKDRYNTTFRQRVQQILCRAFDCDQVEFNTHLSESLLARTQFVLHLDPDKKIVEVNLQQLEQQVVQVLDKQIVRPTIELPNERRCRGFDEKCKRGDRAHVNGHQPLSEATRNCEGMEPRHDQRHWTENQAQQNDVEAKTLKQYEAESACWRNPVKENAYEQQSGRCQYGEIEKCKYRYTPEDQE